MKKTRFLFCLFLGLALTSIGWGQTSLVPVTKSAKRQAIDAKRGVANIQNDDAIFRAREFIRSDSTYYVGWLFEGVYKYNHAADLMGYKNATIPLEKALKLIVKDYGKYIATRTSDLMIYYPAYGFQIDYTLIAGYLVDCYNNINQPEEAYRILRQANKFKIQRNYYLPVYSSLAWLVHRNRYYTEAQYPFLFNSIPENEALANRYLDSGLVQIQKNVRLNAKIFQPGYEKMDRMDIYHYKAILMGYAFKIDSAMHYYDLMRGSGIFSYNNYANLLSVGGNFQEALKNYEIAGGQDGGDKRLQEWAYFSSILHIYQNKPTKAAQDMKDMIRSVGSTPGFGWYNIALARAESYAGQLAESDRHALKAAQFKEVNIGTTLGDGQYSFSTNLVQLVNDKKKIAAQKFEDKGWWYHPLKWGNLLQSSGQRYLQHYLMVNQLALNPERKEVIYPLFATENTVSWDELWYLIEDFSTGYFYKIFEDRYKTDPRPQIKKYYLLFMAKLQMERGNYKEAEQQLTTILNNNDYNPEYNALFLARTYEALAICNQKLKQKEAFLEHAYSFYYYFPQLVPYSEIEMNFRLETQGTVEKTLISNLKDYRINWATKHQANIPKLRLLFTKEGKKQKVSFMVIGNDGVTLIPGTDYVYTDPKEAAKFIAYALFKIDLNYTSDTETKDKNPA